MAYHLTTSRQFIRKHAGLSQLHDALVMQSEQGNISRQEAVSMIPPLLLDVKPNQRVLDMCAAPGSKTAQIIEGVSATDETVPRGLVVANDADSKRCYMLVHQSKRLQSPVFMVVNQDASIFPALFLDSKGGNSRRRKLKFDRVLADVPCSGDGTMRKNPGIWRKWNPFDATGLHPLQYRILRRGIQLLEDGGLIVYSTCSLNPIENEAVVAEALRQHEGLVELVDVSDQLPGLVRDPGMTSWKLMDRDCNWYSSTSEMRPDLRKRFPDSMNPPTAEEAAKFHLERCLRLLPHAQDTGGFFVAVLRKKGAASEEGSSTARGSPTPDAEENASSSEPAKGQRPYSEEPYCFLDQDAERESMMANIREFYGLADDFPWHLVMLRGQTSGKNRHLYVVSEVTRHLIEHNEDRGIRIVNTGVKVMTRTDSSSNTCPYRLCQSGLSTLLPFVTKRVFEATAEDLFAILRDDAPSIFKLSPKLMQNFGDCADGAVALVLRAGELNMRGQPSACDVVLAAW
ncbi:uncharacterized protein MONBRDRAFT_36363, partial [Monosiga brevicollis MX1]